MQQEEGGLADRLQTTAIWLGFGMLIASIYFSYDGLDQKIGTLTFVVGDVPKWIPIVLGVLFALVVTQIQFMFSTRYSDLNLTLKAMGLFAYWYSIWTNWLGLQHVFGWDPTTALVGALLLDIPPEPMIAWGMGESLHGDLLGNIVQWANSFKPRRGRQQNKHQGDNRPPKKDKDDFFNFPGA